MSRSLGVRRWDPVRARPDFATAQCGGFRSFQFFSWRPYRQRVKGWVRSKDQWSVRFHRVMSAPIMTEMTASDHSRWTMCLALEFLTGSRVLLLKLYAQLTPAERRTGVENVRMHGCYHPGVPLLVDTTDNESPDYLTDARALRAALASALPGSAIAILVSENGPSDQALTEGGPVFLSRADALRWLDGWSVRDVALVATDKNPTKRLLRPRRRRPGRLR